MLEQGIADKQYFMERTHVSAVLEERSTLEQFVQDCILWEGLHAESGKSMWKNEQKECYELTLAPIPHAIVSLGAWENRRVTLSKVE